MGTPFKHELGIEAKDVVTGFSGIVMSRSEHLTGCNVYSIVPNKLQDGKLLDTQWFDESRIEQIGQGVTLNSDDTGAGENDPTNSMSRR